ncbi:cytochrome b-c1 complex subunit 6, mitochondrial [Diachasma alloeum]|uniref:11 kDa subunit, ubiquinol-cytochrome c reductase n=1 Tax=Diachasma alloeum TaxID=454923 RepID=A0A4E0RLV5_9HYME|nr:cytochrome b-c1 complex subunit 6, mitochondrial [Diachasma alloeum]THK33109.1 11 kDa subunit, ubiquinol-cytochrome c reductase [Diachasma alloeum]
MVRRNFDTVSYARFIFEPHTISHIVITACSSIVERTQETEMSLIQSFISRFVPIVKAGDEELVDPLKVLREQCSQKPNCVKFQERLSTCNDRVNSRKETEETCLEEIIDYVSCVDHCASKTLFSKLK